MQSTARASAVAALAILAGLAVPSRSATIPYQGLATDSTGHPVPDGPGNVRFRLYRTISGGTFSWEEDRAPVVRKGLFQVDLGGTSLLPDSLFDGRPLYLGVSWNRGPEAAPRAALGAVPFALRARWADSSNAVAGLRDSLQALRRLVGTLAQAHARDSSDIAGLKALLSGVWRKGGEIYFDSVNVNVRNGLGRTDTTNGLGNLVVGYNRNPGGQSRPGSHMVVTGDEQNYFGFGGFMGGRNNYSQAAYGSVLGGSENAVYGPDATITGGQYNAAYGQNSSIAGGMNHEARSELTFLAGGRNSTARFLAASVFGGEGHMAAAPGATIVGGLGNSAYGTYSTVVGGHANTVRDSLGVKP